MHFKKLINVSFNIKSSSIFNQENGQPISGQDIYYATQFRQPAVK